jgi:ABC-2 type transport system ATP-binding protein
MRSAVWGVSGLTVRYRDRVALDQVTLDVPPGMVTAVVGGDGAGKSTLLRALVGGVAPGSGTVRRPPADRIGYFPGASGVYPDLTVNENLDFAASAYHVAAGGRRVELLDAAGLGGARDRLASRLSGGMRQKLGLIMAMLHTPDLLVLDEPATGVDPVSRAELSLLVNRAAAAGTAVALSTVYLDEAERAGQVLVLDRGRTLRVGVPAEVIATVPGRVIARSTRPDDARRSWRRGNGWHCWLPPSETSGPEGGPTDIDLEDAVIVATLERRG